MRLSLINPVNRLVALAKVKKNRWNRYRRWKPLSLLVLGGLTPPEWEVTIVDENVKVPDYATMPRPDLVGITAFTSQANRAYELAAEFHGLGVPVVMGGIHASMCLEEALQRVDSVVTGEAEGIWAQVLEDARNGNMKRVYAGEHANMDEVPLARHDLLPSGYALGAIQTTRGCPLSCSFCTVTAFNGRGYRQRPIDDVVQEFGLIRERRVLIVDDNLIGTRDEHIARAKDLFRAMIRAGLRKEWVAQVTINMADDDELLMLASKSGCKGVFIGFESPTAEGMIEVGKKFNLHGGRDFKASIDRMHRHKILVVGSFILGLDTDRRGIGKQIADTSSRYGVDILNTLFLTPLPGTHLWKDMESQGRIAANSFPEDWQFYTLLFPVACYKHLSSDEMFREMDECVGTFFSVPRILRRFVGNLWRMRSPIFALAIDLSSRKNLALNRKTYREFSLTHDVEK
ncbi:MAG: B12-binding domain-containing radical SAM protein [Phycisphaerae bacterium]|nr:B12-binding domain-containing radical SAM protein [Phycisphaerae bacterium]